MIYYQDEFITLYHGDSRDVLPTLESEIVQTCVTSPPYFGLRDYGTASWDISATENAEIAEKCDHAARPGGGLSKGSTLAGTSNRDGYSSDGQARQQCSKCGAIRVDALRGSYYDEKGIQDFERAKVLKAEGKSIKEISEILGVHFSAAYRMTVDGFEPFESSARYLSDIERQPEWFLNI